MEYLFILIILFDLYIVINLHINKIRYNKILKIVSEISKYELHLKDIKTLQEEMLINMDNFNETNNSFIQSIKNNIKDKNNLK